MNSDVSLIHDRPLMGPWAAPLAYLFGVAARTRLLGFEKSYLKSVHPGVFTVSVGGIEAGGTGKTPWAEYILRAYLDAGRNPGLLSRGYGRSAKGLVLRQKGEKATPVLIGDEPAMIVASGLDVPVAAVSKRVLGASALVQAGCDTIVLDDGFSHRWLKRDVDILVMRGEAPFGSGHFLPRGTLREPVESVQRSNILVLHFRDAVNPQNVDAIRSRWPDKKMVVSTLKVRGPRLDGAGVFVVCAVARPEGVIRSAEKLGGRVVGSRFFADHHRYTERDLHDVRHLAKQAGADALVVTEKDFTKLEALSLTADESDSAVDDLISIGAGVSIQEGQDALTQMLGL